MGLSVSRLMDVHELAQFKQLPLIPDDYELPEPPQNRKLTNKEWFYVFVVTLALLFPFLIYSLVNADIRKVSHGYDSCGNVCGFINERIDGISCSGKDYTEQPYFYEDGGERQCVATCPMDTFQKGFFCLTYISSTTRGDVDVFMEVVHGVLLSLKTYWFRFILSMISTLALCIGALHLYRYATAVVVWSLLGLSTFSVIALAFTFWWAYSAASVENQDAVMVGAITFTIISIVIVIMLIVLFNKIKLLILLYKEATKALFTMPGIIFIPVLSAWIQIIILIAFISSSVYMFTGAFNYAPSDSDSTEASPNYLVLFSIFYNAVMAVWSLELIASCQYMIVAGAVARWFFCRNKASLGSPIITSVITTFKYHVGSLCLGSLIVTLFAIIRALIRSLMRNRRIRIFITCWLGYLERLLRFLSRNAFIEIAIHGEPFLKSARRATDLLMQNAKSVIAINTIGEFILGMTKFLLVILATLISYGLMASENENVAPTLILSVILNLVIVVVTFGIYDVLIDSLFICFCEDKILNDGIAKPFYMTVGLMQFVENTKKLYGEKPDHGPYPITRE